MVKKIGNTADLLIKMFFIVLVVGMGYYYLSLGLKGAIDFGKNVRLNKMLWFFGSLTLISSKAFLLDLKSIKYKILSFFIAFFTMFVAFTITGGVTFAATDISIGMNVKLISQSAIYIAIVVIICFIIVSYWFSDTTGDFLKSLIKSGASLGVIAVVAIVIIPALPF